MDTESSAAATPALLVNLDVPELERAVDFYTRAFNLCVGRRLGPFAVELLGSTAPLYLLVKASGTSAALEGGPTRDYTRHWTPVHLDFVVSNLEAALAQAVAAGAKLEQDITEHSWGRISLLSDPFGHGFCLLQFTGSGYDAIAV